MNRKKKRILSLLLAAILCMGVLSACGSSPAGNDSTVPAKSDTADQDQPSDTQQSAEPSQPEEPAGPDISEEVTLTMYLIGDRPVDNDEVFAKINERLKAV